MDALAILTLGFICLSCFLMGAKVGQTVSKGEDIELPSVNPMDAYRKHEAKKEAQKEHDRLDTIMRNIESYDGTSTGQREVK